MKNLLQHAVIQNVVKASVTTNQKQGFYNLINHSIYHSTKRAKIWLFALLLVFVCSKSFATGAISVTTTQNGKNATITATICPYDPLTDATFDSPSLVYNTGTVAIQSVTESTENINGVSCYKMIIQVLKKKPGLDRIQIKRGQDSTTVRFELFQDLFSMSIPGHMNDGSFLVSGFQPGQSVNMLLKVIDTQTGNYNPASSGYANAIIIGSGFTFSNGSMTKVINFANGMASVTLNAANPNSGYCYFKIIDDSLPASVSSASILHDAMISLTSPPLVNSISANNVSCGAFNNGSATMSVTGGTMPYVYSCSNGIGNSNNPNFSGLAPGTYTATVTDFYGMASSGTFTISPPSPLNINATVIQPVCNLTGSGSINVSVPGSSPVNFLWNDGSTLASRSNLLPGNYNLIANDANGCMGTGSYNLTGVNAAPEIVNHDDIIVRLLPGKNYAVVNYTVNFIDECSGSLNIVCNPPSGSSFYKGITHVTCKATDNLGLTGSISFNVIVNDEQAPNAKYSDITLSLNANGSATLIPAMLNDNSTDNCGIISKVITPAVLSCSNIGTNNVTVKVTDGNNNYWVIDSISVKYFNSNGILINTYTTLGKASVIVTLDGGFIVYNPITGVMTKYNKEGVLQSTIIVSNTGKASTITLTANGCFMVYDPNTGIMKLYNSDGVLISTIIVSNTGAASTITTLTGCGFIVYDPNTGVMKLYGNDGVLKTTIIVSNTGGASTITVLPDCSFIVYDPNTGIMYLYSSNGDLLTTIIVSNTGAASTITILPDCGFIVYDPNTGIMKLYNNAGVLLTTIIVSNTGAASTITTFPDCSFIVYDPNTGIVSKYNKDGVLQSTIIVSNTGAASTITPTDDGGFIVHDPNTGLIKKYDKDGNLLVTIIVSNTGAASTITPTDDGGFIVYDPNTGLIKKYDKDGNLLVTIIVSNTGAASTITLLDGGGFIVYDPNTGLIKKYDKDGNLQVTIIVSNTGAASTITLTADGGFIVYDPNTGLIKKYDKDGNLQVTIIVSNTGTASTITLTAGGGFIVHDPNTGLLKKYDKDGNLQATIITTGTVKIVPDVTGGFKVTDNGVQIRVYDKNGILVSTTFTSGESYIYTNSELSATDTVQVTVLNPIAVTGTVQNVNCSGLKTGKITLTVTGITSPYTYLWSNGKTAKNLTNIGAGTYTCNISDSHGCNNSITFTVGQPAPLALVATKTTIKCGGASTGTVTASASGGTAPYTFSWNTIPVKTGSSVSGLPAGTYIVTVTDANGCTKTRSVAITQNQPVSIAIQQSFDHATAVPTGGVGSYTYKWNTVPPQTNATATGLICNHTYKVTVKDSKGCSAEVTFTLTCPRVGESIDNNEQISVFPNPTSGFVNIALAEIENGNYQLQLIDITGREVFTKEVELVDGTITLDFGQQANGIYSLQINAGNKLFTSKVVIQN